jgi:transcriptional regulator with XRE-family HTH domain
MTATGTYLRSVREKLGLVVEDVVAQSNGQLSKSMMSRVETNERKLSLKYAYLLSEIYGIDLKELCVKDMRNQGVKIKKLK